MTNDQRINVPIGDCQPNLWNPNEMTDFMYDKARRSILVFGFVDPITVREVGDKYEIIDGEHRWKVMLQLREGAHTLDGEETQLLTHNLPLQAMIDEGIIPAVNLGAIGDSVAKEITIVLNELRGKFDTIKLSELVAQLEKDVGRAELEGVLPYDPDELGNLIDLLDYDPDQYEDSSEELEEEASNEWVTWQITFPKDTAPIIESEFERIGEILQVKPAMNEKVQRGLALEKICVLSAQTPTESLL